MEATKETDETASFSETTREMRAHKEPEEVNFEVRSFQHLSSVCLQEVMEYSN
jgi:hypothetical protein